MALPPRKVNTPTFATHLHTLRLALKAEEGKYAPPPCPISPVD